LEGPEDIDDEEDEFERSLYGKAVSHGLGLCLISFLTGCSHLLLPSLTQGYGKKKKKMKKMKMMKKKKKKTNKKN